MVCFIRHTYMQRVTVCVAVYCNTVQPKFAARANHTYSYFTPVRNKHLLKRPLSHRSAIDRVCTSIHDFRGSFTIRCYSLCIV